MTVIPQQAIFSLNSCSYTFCKRNQVFDNVIAIYFDCKFFEVNKSEILCFIFENFLFYLVYSYTTQTALYVLLNSIQITAQ